MHALTVSSHTFLVCLSPNTAASDSMTRASLVNSRHVELLPRSIHIRLLLRLLHREQPLVQREIILELGSVPFFTDNSKVTHNYWSGL